MIWLGVIMRTIVFAVALSVAACGHADDHDQGTPEPTGVLAIGGGPHDTGATSLAIGMTGGTFIPGGQAHGLGEDVVASSATIEASIGHRAFFGDADVFSSSGTVSTTSHIRITTQTAAGYGLVWLRDVDTSMFFHDGTYVIHVPADVHDSGPGLFNTVVACSGPDGTDLPFDAFEPAEITVAGGSVDVRIFALDDSNARASFDFTLQ